MSIKKAKILSDKSNLPPIPTNRAHINRSDYEMKVHAIDFDEQ